MFPKPESNLPISEETKQTCWVQNRGRERKEEKPRALLAAHGPTQMLPVSKATLGLHLKRLLCQVVAPKLAASNPPRHPFPRLTLNPVGFLGYN